MNHGVTAEGAQDRCANGLAPIDHEQLRLLNVQPSRAAIDE
jgi:hypothetical protein